MTGLHLLDAIRGWLWDVVPWFIGLYFVGVAWVLLHEVNMTFTKAIGGFFGAAVGASPIGDAAASIVYWMFQKVPMLADIPQEPLKVLVVAAVTAACVYVAPANKPKEA